MPPKPMPERQLAELKKLREMVEEIKSDIDKEANKPFWKKGLAAFAVGILRGIGFVVGTTIVAAAIIYALQFFLDWTQIQIDVVDWLTETVRSGISGSIPSVPSLFE